MYCRFAITLGYPNTESPQFVHTLGTADPIANLRHAADLGFAGADDPFLLKRPHTEQAAIGKALAELGLEFGNAVLAPGDSRQPLWGLTGDEARGEIDRRLTTAMDAVARVGGRYITVITGRDPDRERAPQLAAMVENLKWVVPRLEQTGAVLCVEPTSNNRIPNMLTDNLDDAHQVVDAVDSPHVRLLFDTMPVQSVSGNLIESLQRTWQTIGMVQIADVPGRLEPGSGEINFVNFIRAVLALDYKGIITLEHALSRPDAEGERQALGALMAIDAAVAAA